MWPVPVAVAAPRWLLGHPTSNNIKISQKGNQLASATHHFTWSIHLAQVACMQLAGEGQQRYKYLPPPRLQLTSFFPSFTKLLDMSICRAVHLSSSVTAKSTVLSLTSFPLTQPPFVAEPHYTSPQGKSITLLVASSSTSLFHPSINPSPLHQTGKPVSDLFERAQARHPLAVRDYSS